MERPVVACAQEVHELLSLTASKCLTDPRLPHLNNAINAVVDKLLAIQLKHVKIGIKEHIQLQAAMIFSSDKDFVKVLTEGPKPEDDELIQELIKSVPVKPIVVDTPKMTFGKSTRRNASHLSHLFR